METTRQVNRTTRIPIRLGRPSNDNRQKPLSTGRSVFPDDAIARICRPSRPVTTSGTARARGWRLVFERRAAPFIEPLMGYTGGRDTLTQVELNFPTLESAVRYAERQGLTYVIEAPAGRTATDRSRPVDEKPARAGRSMHAFCDATLDRLGLAAFRESYGRALDGAANRNDPQGPEGWATPMGVIRDPSLTLEARRSILMNWAWTEYLIDQATNEGMPENDRPSRLDEVEQALLALEREVAGGRDDSGTREAA
ncbi:NADH dehydrogenase ubiquinone Fe-S protein 4 [Shinella sp. BYT-45]|uniref:NADH dehydrogenase ubiquinone Fe-S protein 4 n=1 Tax=Shinella sp. BYT-45 TaxID=3377377 RepID=UPI0039811460